MPKTFGYLLIRLRMEKDKLLVWGVLAKLPEYDNPTRQVPRLHRHTIIEALDEIKILLLDTTKMEQRYKLKLTVPAEGTISNPTNTLGSSVSVIRGIGGHVSNENLRLRKMMIILNSSVRLWISSIRRGDTRRDCDGPHSIRPGSRTFSLICGL